MTTPIPPLWGLGHDLVVNAEEFHGKCNEGGRSFMGILPGVVNRCYMRRI